MNSQTYLYLNILEYETSHEIYAIFMLAFKQFKNKVLQSYLNRNDPEVLIFADKIQDYLHFIES